VLSMKAEVVLICVASRGCMAKGLRWPVRVWRARRLTLACGKHTHFGKRMNNWRFGNYARDRKGERHICAKKRERERKSCLTVHVPVLGRCYISLRLSQSN
jgi:hypothetical protein